MEQSATLREREGSSYGGSAEGIRDHYDIGNAFWPLVLGPTLAYSCALFASPNEDLDTAQRRKLDWHMVKSGAKTARSVLDIGCGWGSVLRPLSLLENTEHITGITLSAAQLSWLQQQASPKVEVRLQNWAEYTPKIRYDAIISVGAFEHFAKREESAAERLSVYRDFFERCQGWLAPGGRMSLQTIAYGKMRREDASEFMAEIFPDSELPFLSEIAAAAEGLFEIVALRNDRLHYAMTTDRWASNLRHHRAAAVELVGEDRVERMLRYFKLVSIGFRSGKQCLLRMALRPLNQNWKELATESWEPQCQ